MSKPKVTSGQMSLSVEHGEPVVVTTGKWAVCTTKGVVLVAHLSFETAKAQAKKLAMERQICTKLVLAK